MIYDFSSSREDVEGVEVEKIRDSNLMIPHAIRLTGKYV